MSNVNVGVVIRLFDAITAPIEKLTGKIQNLGGKAAQAVSGGNGVTKVTNNINKTSAAVDKVTAATGKWTDATGGLVDQFGNNFPGIATDIDKVSDAIEDIGKQSENATDKVEDLVDKLDDASGKLDKLRGASGAIMRAGAISAAAGAGMIAAVTMPVMSAVSNDAAMRQIKVATMRSDGVNEFDAVEGTIGSLAGYKSKLDLSEMAAGMFAAGAKADVINNGGLKAAHDLAVLGGLDNMAVGRQLADLSQNAGITNFDVLKDIIVRSSHASGMDMGQMMAGLTGLATQGKNLGITGEKDLADVSRVLAGLSMSGVENGESVVSGVLSSLPRLGEKLKYSKGWKSQEGADIMRKFGIGDLTGQLFDKDGNLQGDDLQSRWGNIVKVIDSINTAKDAKGAGIGDKDKMVLLKELFGEGTANGLVNLDLGMMNEALTKMAEQASVDDKMKEMTEGPAARFQLLKNEVNASMIEIGKTVLPIVNDLLARISEIIKKVGGWIKQHPELIRFAMVLTGALGGLLVAGGSVATTIGSLGVAVSSVSKFLPMMKGGLLAIKAGFLAASGGVWSFTAALLASPITWIVLAVAGAGLLIWKYWEPIKEMLSKVWASFKEAGPTADILVSATMPVIGIPMLIIKHWDKIKSKFSEVWEWFKEAGPAVDVLVVAMSPLIGIPLLIIKYWDEIKAFFAGFCETLKAGWGPVGAEFKIVGDMLCDVFDGLWEAVKSLFGVFGVIIDLADELFGMFGVGSSKADELTGSVDGVSESLGGVGEAFKMGKLVAALFLGELMKIAKTIEFVLAIIQTLLAAVETVFEALATPNKLGLNFIKNLKDGKGFVSSIKGMFDGTGDRFAKPWERVGGAWSKLNTPVAVKNPIDGIVDVGKAGKVGRVKPDLTNQPVDRVARTMAAADPLEISKGKIDTTPQSVANPRASATAVATTKKEIKGGDVTIHYEPRLEFHADAKDTDKNWFGKQLDEHKELMARLVKEQLDAQGRWMAAQL